MRCPGQWRPRTLLVLVRQGAHDTKYIGEQGEVRAAIWYALCSVKQRTSSAAHAMHMALHTDGLEIMH